MPRWRGRAGGNGLYEVVYFWQLGAPPPALKCGVDCVCAVDFIYIYSTANHIYINVCVIIFLFSGFWSFVKSKIIMTTKQIHLHRQ